MAEAIAALAGVLGGRPELMLLAIVVLAIVVVAKVQGNNANQGRFFTITLVLAIIATGLVLVLLIRETFTQYRGESPYEIRDDAPT